MIKAIRAAAKKLGYKVHATRQEKIESGGLVIVVDDVDVRINENNSYYAYVWVLIEWSTSNGDGIPESIVKLVKELDVAMYTDSSESCKATFKFIQSEVNLLGTTYMVSVTVEYVDLIDV